MTGDLSAEREAQLREPAARLREHREGGAGE